MSVCEVLSQKIGSLPGGYRKYNKVQKSVTMNDPKRQMAVILRYVTEFDIFGGQLRNIG